MTEAEKKFLVDLQGLLFFKSEQDKENLEKFIKKDEALSSLGAISYLIKQNLTETQKAQARENIGAGTGDGTGSIEGAVRYDEEQTLTDEEKARARENIGTTDGTWENMPDKPFYKTGVSYEWDGNTEGLEKISIAENISFYKISSDVLSQDELLGASLKSYWGEGDIEGEISQDGSISIAQTSAGNLLVLSYGQLPILCVSSQLGEDTFANATFTVESTGLWFLHGPGENEYTQYLKIYFVKKIDKEFLPDDINVELPEGLVTTDENGLIPASKLPSYVDDVIEGYYVELSINAPGHFEYAEGGRISPESGKIYVDLNTSNTYRWSGSIYVQLNPKEYTIATNDQILELFN